MRLALCHQQVSVVFPVRVAANFAAHGIEHGRNKGERVFRPILRPRPATRMFVRRYVELGAFSHGGQEDAVHIGGAIEARFVRKGFEIGRGGDQVAPGGVVADDRRIESAEEDLSARVAVKQLQDTSTAFTGIPGPAVELSYQPVRR